MLKVKQLWVVEADDQAKYDILHKLVSSLPGVSVLIMGITKKESTDETHKSSTD